MKLLYYMRRINTET